MNFFIFIFSFILFFIGSSFKIGMENKIYVNFLGSVSSLLEGLMPLAQIYKIYSEKSLGNFSNVLVLSWVLGDSFKAYYYIESKVPIQLVLSAIMQLLLDFTIIFQIFYYRKNDKSLQTPKDRELNKVE